MASAHSDRSFLYSSALYATLKGDPVYVAHRRRPQPDATDWAILSADVPVFRDDDGTVLDAPYWTLSILTCAAPYAPALGQLCAGDLLDARIRRVLAIARAFGYSALVLGGVGLWGVRQRSRAHRGGLQDRARRARRGLHRGRLRHLGPFRDLLAGGSRRGGGTEASG